MDCGRRRHTLVGGAFDVPEDEVLLARQALRSACDAVVSGARGMGRGGEGGSRDDLVLAHGAEGELARSAREALEEADAEQEVERILARGGVWDDRLGLLRGDLLDGRSAILKREEIRADLLGGGERGLVEAALELVRGALAHRAHTKKLRKRTRLWHLSAHVTLVQMARWQLRRRSPQTRATLQRRSHPRVPSAGLRCAFVRRSGLPGPTGALRTRHSLGARRRHSVRTPAPGWWRLASPARARGVRCVRCVCMCGARGPCAASPQLSRRQYSRPRPHAGDGKTQKAVWPCLVAPRRRAGTQRATRRHAARIAQRGANRCQMGLHGGFLRCLLDTSR